MAIPESLLSKVTILMTADLQVNGVYLNAPYKITINDEIYKAYIQLANPEDGGMVHIKIVRPKLVLLNGVAYPAQKECMSQPADAIVTSAKPLRKQC